MADHPMTVDEFNEATSGFYAVLVDDIAHALTRMERQNEEMLRLIRAIAIGMGAERDPDRPNPTSRKW